MPQPDSVDLATCLARLRLGGEGTASAYADRDGHIAYIYNSTLWKHATGDYRFWLTSSLDSVSLPNGAYWVDVQASNLAGAVGENMLAITVAN